MTKKIKIKNWPEYIRMSPDDIAIDPTIQRDHETSEARRLIEKIKREFDPQLYDPVKVIRRTHGDRKYTGVDGGHRLIAAQEMGIEKIPAILVAGRSYKHEGRIFTQGNKERRKVSPVDLYRVTADTDPDSVEAITRGILAQKKFRVDTGDGNRTLSCANQVVSAYNSLGGHGFRIMVEGLNLVPAKVEKIHGYVINGLTYAMSRTDMSEWVEMTSYYWEQFDRVMGKAKEVTGGNVSSNPRAVGEALLEDWEQFE